MLSAAKHLLFLIENKQSRSFAKFTLSRQSQILRCAQDDSKGLRMTSAGGSFSSLLRVGFQGLLVTSDGGLILVRELRRLWPQRNRSREIPKTERCPRKPIGHVAVSGFVIRVRADGKLFGAAGSALGRRLHRSGSKGGNRVYTHCCRETIRRIPINPDWAGPEVGWHKQEWGVQGIHRLRKNS